MEAGTSNQRDPVSPLYHTGKFRNFRYSPRTKNKAIKPNNCFFCPANCDNKDLEDHLNSSFDCKAKYLKLTKAGSVTGALLLVTDCIYCNRKFEQLGHHLRSEKDCLKKYEERFSVVGQSAVLVQIKKCKRLSIKSQNSQSRNKVGTKSEGLSNFRSKCLFSNYKLCVSCKMNVSESMASEVKESSELYEEKQLDSPDKQILRRQGKFWLCNGCSGSKEVREPIVQSQLKLVPHYCDEHKNIRFLPEVYQDQIETDSNLERNNNDEHDINSSPVSIFMPCSVAAVGYYSRIPKVPAKLLERLLYSAEELRRETIEIIYQSQVHKYYLAKNHSDLFYGNILDPDRRILSNIEMNVHESKIHSSDSWCFVQEEDMKWRMRQLGKACLRVTVKIPDDCDEVLSTILLQQGMVVTVKMESNFCGEFVKTYWVHTSHLTSADCDGGRDCCKVILKDFCGNFSLKNKFLATYISTVSLKAREFIKNIVKCEGSPLFSKFYTFQVTFNQDGICFVDGIIWPERFKDYNCLGEEGVLLDTLCESISTSSNAEVLEKQFDLSTQSAAELKTIVDKYQVKQTIDGFKSPEIPFPCIVQMLKIKPKVLENIDNSKQFFKQVKILLSSLSSEDLLTLSTPEVLTMIQEQFFDKGRIIETDPEVWKFSLNSVDMQIVFERPLIQLHQLTDNPFFALYHFCLGCSSEDEIILRRQFILDCFTIPFNDLMLKAANSEVLVQPVKGYSEWTASRVRHNFIGHQQTDISMNGHRNISLSEAISLTDPRKVEVLSSNSMAFVYSLPEARLLFKKATKDSDPGSCFSLSGNQSVVKYEVVNSIVTRYFMRENGKSLLLAEVAVHYQFTSKEISAQLYGLHKSHMDSIETTDVTGVVADESLPQYLLCSNGDVLQKKPPKILKYIESEEDTYNFRYSRVLLFRLVDKLDDLDEARVNQLFMEYSADDEMTVLEKYERDMYNKLRSFH